MFMLIPLYLRILRFNPILGYCFRYLYNIITNKFLFFFVAVALVKLYLGEYFIPLTFSNFRVF